MVRDIVEDQFIRIEKEKLKQMGFKKKKYVWIREEEVITSIFSIQFSTADIGNVGKFTFNIEVYINIESMWGCDFSVKSIGFRCRSGEIIYGNDHWYKTDGVVDNEIEIAKKDFESDLVKMLIDCKTIKGIVKYFGNSRKDLNAIILWSIYGNYKKALEVGEFVLKSVKDWEIERKDEIKKIIGVIEQKELTASNLTTAST